MPDPIKDLYNAVKDNGIFLDENDFRSQLTKSPKDVYSTVSDLFVDYDDFENVLGFKKKVGTEVLPATSDMSAVSPSQLPSIGDDQIIKRYERVSKGTGYLNSLIEDRRKADPIFSNTASDFLRTSAELNSKGLKPQRTSLVYDFLSKNADIETNDDTREAFIRSQYAGTYFSESPDLISEYQKSDLNTSLTPRQFSGLKSLSFGKQSEYQNAINKLKDSSVSDVDKEVVKLGLDKIGIDIDQDAASAMMTQNLNADIAKSIYAKAENDRPLIDERVRQIDYENPYSVRSLGNIVSNAVKRGFAMGNTADILTATSNETGIDIDKLATIQKEMQEAKASKAYEEFSNDPSLENFKKNPIGITAEFLLESLTALYSHGSTRIAAGAATGAGLGATVFGVGAIPGASTGAIAGLGMASLNLEYSSSILEQLGNMGVDVTNADQLRNAFADDKMMDELKSFAYKRSIPISVIDMLSAGVAGKMISKPSKTLIGKVLKAGGETAVQAGLGGAGEAAGQLVSEGKITNPNAIIMEMFGEIAPGTVEVAYGGIVESAKRNRPASKVELVSVASSKSLDDIRFNLESQVASGNITLDQAEAVRKNIANVQANLGKVPQDLSSNAKAEILDLVDQKSKLVEQSKTLDDAFKPEVNQQIKDIDQQILDITKKDRNAVNESKVEIAGTESDIVQPQGTQAGQPEVGQGAGQQGQAAQPQANVGDSNIGGQGELVSPELSKIERLTPEQIEVTNDPTEFANQLESAQKSLGSTGVSVTPYGQEQYNEEAAKGGKFLRAADNKVLALLKSTGEMVSLVKDASVKAKGAAQAMIGKMKDMGGLFMDNYDIYLTPLYEKAGYKVVARVPFDETYAPEGWNNEDSPLKNKPDVVFMVRNDIAPEQAQTFGEYGQAEDYVKGLVNNAVKEGRAQTPAQMDRISSMAGELSDDIGGIDNAVREAVDVASKSIEKTGIKFSIVDSSTDTNEAKRARGNQGLFISKEGAIIIDKSKLADEIEAGLVVWHEASHPVMNIIRNTNKPLYDAVVRGLNDAAGKDQGVKGALDWAQSQEQYDNVDTQNDEAIVETIGRINAGVIDVSKLDTGLRQKLIDFVNSIAKILGIDPILNDTDLAAFKKTVSEVADALKTGRDISEVVGEPNIKEYGVPVGVPVQPRVAEKYGPKVKHDGGSYKLSFVKPSDIIDIKSLVKDIADNGQKVWFWTADQLGRGMYYDNVIEGEHYLDAGPSFALDPKNRDKGVIWATGKGEKWVNDKIANSDYIFIISGSPQKSKLFNKRVAEITFNRIKKAVGEEGSWDKFKSEVLGVSKIGKINEILNKYNSFDELLASPDRKELLIQFDAQKEKKGTPLKGLLEKYGAFIDYNDLRDGFFKDNDFKMNDVMLILKPTGYGGKSAHSTYENDILGEVVGVPDRKVNAYDLMPDEFKAKYAPDISRTEQSQAVAPYGAGVREVQASVGNRDIIKGFYSPIEDRINTFKQPKASVQKWKEIVGVKSDEAVFSGLADWLGGMKPDQQVSKEEVLKFMKDNRIEINEIQIVDPSEEDIESFMNDEAGEGYTREEAIEYLRGEEGAVKYYQYQLPGGENYKEVLITLPQSKSMQKYSVEQDIRLPNTFYVVNEQTGVKIKFNSYESAQAQANRLSSQPSIDFEKNFTSSHFDEPNIITHLRMNTRTDADGKKVLFLEEVQSDWGQKGKKEGFNLSKNEVDEKYKAANKALDDLEKRLTDKYGNGWDMSGDIEDKLTPSEYTEYRNASTERAKWGNRTGKGYDVGTPSAPYVTNTNAWVKLGLKVALKEAVKQGADRIAWTTGDQQNERYDLSKKVDEVIYNPTAKILRIKNADGTQSVFENTSENQIEDYIGKEPARNLINVEPDKSGLKKVKGEGLKVGGKGMKAFYGDAKNTGIVGNVAKALVKELTGNNAEIVESNIDTSAPIAKQEFRVDNNPNAPMGRTWLVLDSEGGVRARETNRTDAMNAMRELTNRSMDARSKGRKIQPAIDITSELRQAVEGGMPQFSVGNRSEQSKDFKVAAFAMRKLGEGADKNEIAQGIASATGMSVEDANKIIADPEQFIRNSFPQLSKIAQDNLIERAKIQNIYRGRQFGMPINKAFVGTEVPRSRVVEYLNNTDKKDSSFKESVKDFKKKWLDPAKGLPDWVLAIRDFSIGRKNIEVARAVKTIERLKDEAKKIGFTDWDAFSKAMVAVRDVQRYIPDESGIVPFDAYRAAEGRMFTTPDNMLPAVIPDELKAIPESLRPFAVQMRQQIDGITKDLIGSGYVTPEQAVTLEKNLGQYVNRAYKMYNERGFRPNPDQVVDAIKFIADQKIKQILTELFPDGKPSTSRAVSDFRGNVMDPENLNMEDLYNQAVEEAKKDVQAILDKKRNPYFNTKTDSRDTGILKERKDIPEPIRKLMGEYTDPGTVFVMTVAKQAALAAQSEYLTKLRDFGMGSIFFEKNDKNRPSEFSVEIASTGTETKSPLGGLYTTPEIAEALEMADPSYNELTNAWMKIVGAVRWGKTVGSVATQAKNFESNIGFAVLNGMFLTGQNSQSLKAAAKYVKGQYSKAEMDEITEKAIKLNLVGQSVGARELSEMLGSGDIHDIALDVAANPNNVWGKKVKKSVDIFSAANKLYRMGDDFWKVYAYINEREMVARGRYKTSYESLTKEQQDKVDIESSERVKNTWPTYDRVVEGAKYVSKRAPIFGNFISFQAESLRVLANSVKMAREDMKDPEMREAGIKRAVGIMTYAGLRAAITYAAAQAGGMAMSGILGAALGDDEEEQKKRAFKKAMPIYARTSDIAVVPTDQPHKFTAFSLSSLDPYGIIPNSLNAFTEGREGIFSKQMDPGFAAAGAEFFSGFLEPEMTFSTMYSVLNNINPRTGRPIVLDSDTPSEISKKISGFVLDQLQPSTISLVERGMERGWKPELASFVGARPIDIDLHKSFGYALSDMSKQMDAIKSEYNSVKFDEKATQAEKDKAEAEAERKKAFLISKVSETYKDFIKVGANPKVLNEMISERSAIKTTGFDKATKNAIKTGEVDPKKLFK